MWFGAANQPPDDPVAFFVDRKVQGDLAVVICPGESGFDFVFTGPGGLVAVKRPRDSLDYRRFPRPVGSDDTDNAVREIYSNAFDYPVIAYFERD